MIWLTQRELAMCEPLFSVALYSPNGSVRNIVLSLPFSQLENRSIGRVDNLPLVIALVSSKAKIQNWAIFLQSLCT